MTIFKYLIFLLPLIVVSGLESAPKKYYTRQQTNLKSIDELHHLIEDIKYESSNHETEIRMFEEKLNNQEIAVDNLWKQLQDSSQTNREKIKDHFSIIEPKLESLEKASNVTLSDVEKIKKHLHDSTNSVVQYSQKVSHLEKIIEIQNQNIEHLQAALHSLMDALQIKDVPLETEDPFHLSSSVYQVKPGDSLEKIARKHNTSVSRLKEINHLMNNNDLIIVGQKLKLPE